MRLQTILPYCIGVNTASLTGVADGGTLGYTYEWDDNNNLPQTTTTASALLADNYNSSDSSYTITVTDAKGCTASVSTDTLRFYVESMDASVTSLYQYASGSLDSNEVSCFGYNDGGAEVTALGLMLLMLINGLEVLLLLQLVLIICIQEFIQ